MPAPISIGTIAELSPLLASALESVDPSLHDEIVREVAEALEKPTERAPVTRRLDPSLDEANTYYVVHDGDLNLLKDAVSTAVALIPTFNPLTALPALVALLFRYRRKRARIDAEQAAVLMCLRSAPPGGYTVNELTRALALKAPLDEKRALEVLRSLKGLLLENGERSDFVVQSGDIWTACDV